MERREKKEYQNLKETDTGDFGWKEDEKKQATGVFLWSAESSFKSKNRAKE